MESYSFTVSLVIFFIPHFFHISFLISHLFQIESLLMHKSFHCFVHSQHASLYFSSSSPSLGERGIKTACNIQVVCTTRTACSVLILSALTDTRWTVFPRHISWHLSTLNYYCFIIRYRGKLRCYVSRVLTCLAHFSSVLSDTSEFDKKKQMFVLTHMKFLYRLNHRTTQSVAVNRS